ncbi:Rha family transcriptional regulator [Listeria monocytogenes]|nr:Rha family transcriptional regulator [Listeria monocytogenes]
MKELIPKDQYGVFADTKDIARVDSLFVADFFGKDHKNVLRDIREIISDESGLSPEFARLNFEQSSYRNQQNKRQPCYFMTRDGFTMLVMGYTGKKAMQFKELYIKRFNEMEATIKHLVSLRLEYPLLTDNITLMNPSPKPYHYINEVNMLNRIVTGMSAKEYKLAKGIDLSVSSIRPFMTEREREILDMLQKIDAGLVISEPDFQKRKQQLEWYKMKKFGGKEND